MRSELLKSLDTVRGKECWGFIAGPGTGSMITLDFGGKIPRRKPISNPTLSGEQQKFQGDVVLFIQFAAWRIDSASSVICSSTSPNDLDGPFGEGFRSLLRKRVMNIDVSSPGCDLMIEFENGFVLRVFCDQVNGEDNVCNYSLHLREKVVSVGTGSQVVVESS